MLPAKWLQFLYFLARIADQSGMWASCIDFDGDWLCASSPLAMQRPV